MLDDFRVRRCLAVERHDNSPPRLRVNPVAEKLYRLANIDQGLFNRLTLRLTAVQLRAPRVPAVIVLLDYYANLACHSFMLCPRVDVEVQLPILPDISLCTHLGGKGIVFSAAQDRLLDRREQNSAIRAIRTA